MNKSNKAQQQIINAVPDILPEGLLEGEKHTQKVWERDVVIKGHKVHIKSIFSNHTTFDKALKNILLRKSSEQENRTSAINSILPSASLAYR